MSTLTLNKDQPKTAPVNKGTGSSHLHRINGMQATFTLSTGTQVSGRVEKVAMYDVLMTVGSKKVIVHKQHIVMCELTKYGQRFERPIEAQK